MITIKLRLCALIFLLSNTLLQQVLSHNNTNSAWLKNHTKSALITNLGRGKPPMCKPWNCKRTGPPMARMRCCRNQCIDVLSDPNHCRFCFRRCRFGLSCCDGDCVDTKNDPSNCGQCGNKCESRAPCEFGLCGYAAPTSSPPGKRHRRPKHKSPPSPPSMDGVLHDDRDDE